MIEVWRVSAIHVYPVFSVQYHPEAAPGPEDANYLFDQFMELMEKENA